MIENGDRHDPRTPQQRAERRRTTVQPAAKRPSQRSLVEASLLRCPDRPGPDAPTARH
jgi:hypothetical protein